MNRVQVVVFEVSAFTYFSLDLDLPPRAAGRLRLPFSCSRAGSRGERRDGERPLRPGGRLARAKAAAVALQHPDAWIIGSDQVAVLDGPAGELILGKPGTEARCIEQLRGCSGATRRLPDGRRGGAPQRARRIRIHRHHTGGISRLDEATIARYVALEQPSRLRRRLQERGPRHHALRIDRQRGSKRPDRTAADSIEPRCCAAPDSSSLGALSRRAFRAAALARLGAPRALLRPLRFTRRDGIEHRRQLRRQRRADVERHAGTGPLEGHAIVRAGMCASIRAALVRHCVAIAVLVIAQQRMARRRKHARESDGCARSECPPPSASRANRKTAPA